MATTKDDLLAVVDKLIADVAAQNQANAEKLQADADVTNAVQSQAVKAAAHNSATAQVTQDLAALKATADAFGDEDETT